MKTTIQFTIHLKKIPTVTHQMQRITVHGGRPQVYEDAALADARQLFCAHLAQHAPEKPLDGPLSLTTSWLYGTTSKKKAGTWKTTKPDTDNLIKLFKDCMGRVGYFDDDAQIVIESTAKMWDTRSKIVVVLYQLDKRVGGEA